MGRWGMRIFEGDQDLDIAIEINQALGDNDDVNLGLSQMIHQTDMICPQEIRAYYKTDEYKRELEDIVSDCRDELNSGTGDELFEIFRKKEHEPDGKYRVILVGAIMMRAGAAIKKDDFDHLRELVPEIQCRDGLHPAVRSVTGLLSALAVPGADHLHGRDKGFRHPGKVQFLAALDNYKTGVPRSFQVPSCHSCGKIAADNGEATLSQCSKCKRAWYCNTACQRAHRKAHKSACIPPERQFSMNV